MSARSSLSKARWNRIDSSMQRLSRADESDLWKMNEQSRVDKKTKQRINFQCKVAPIKQIRLHAGELMIKPQLEAVLEQCLPTRIPTCKLYCLNDQIRMSRIKTLGSGGPYHDSLPYSDIVCWTSGVENPDMFAVYIEESRRGKRFCEVYQCNRSDHVSQIIYLLDRAHQNPEYRLRQQSRALSIQSDILRSPESETTDYRNPSLPRLSFDTNDLPKRLLDPGSSESVFPHETNGQANGHDSHPDRSELEDGQKVARVKRRISSLAISDRTTLGQTSKIDPDLVNSVQYVTRSTEFSPVSMESNGFQRSDDVEWEQYVTYLEPDPVHGARIAKHGPIYMFAMRVEADPVIV
ncbi:hypothetical protein FBUS_09884 [Fasciolopsis buskii]|uniref:Trematode PH-like domain-containing protein n=1 Tax=Fasciolopsis buskii TaxID=27845 RepID=A0A8E0RWP7_9TREM|nr:hypothetical protein FBUS_09884 [Fasciolopsis buski]